MTRTRGAIAAHDRGARCGHNRSFDISAWIVDNRADEKPRRSVTGERRPELAPRHEATAV